MVLCDKDCIPCCDFCMYAIHEKIPVDGDMIDGAPIGCSRHPSIKYQRIAENNGDCDDFHCFNVAY